MRRVGMMSGLLALAASVQAAEMLAPGDPFPAWALRDQAGVRLASTALAGKIYLLWYYPKAMTGG